MNSFNATQRLTALYCFLAAQTHPVNATTIRAHVNGYDAHETDEAFERKFRRDRGELEQLGVLIDEHQGYYELMQPALERRALHLDAEEAATLRACGASALSNPSLIPHAELLRALNKLTDDPIEYVSNLEHIDEFEGRNSEPAIRILSALQNNKTLTFSYTTSKGKSGARTLDPYTLHCVKGDWYVSGLDRTAAHDTLPVAPKVKTFRFDRMEDVRLVNPRKMLPDFELPPDYHTEEPSFSFDIGSEHLEVTLFFDISNLWKAETLIKGRGTSTLTEEGLFWCLPVADRNRFFEWLALNTPDVKLVEPRELIDEWIARLSHIALEKGDFDGSPQ